MKELAIDKALNQEELKQAVVRSHAAYNRIHELTDYYNHQMAGGKWN